MGITILIKETQKLLALFLLCEDTMKLVGILQPRRRLSPESDPASTLILDIQPPEL